MLSASMPLWRNSSKMPRHESRIQYEFGGFFALSLSPGAPVFPEGTNQLRVVLPDFLVGCACNVRFPFFKAAFI